MTAKLVNNTYYRNCKFTFVSSAGHFLSINPYPANVENMVSS